SDLDFGPGVAVQRVVSVAPDLARVEVQVAKEAVIGPRDVGVAGVYRQAAAVVYDKIDAVKVKPQAGLARVGGGVFPKQLEHFEGSAYRKGREGRRETKAAFDRGAIEVAWSAEKYTATFDDDDKEYVGSLDDNGLFTPNVDGPNPKRRNHADNYGDVWVV